MSCGQILFFYQTTMHNISCIHLFYRNYNIIRSYSKIQISCTSFFYFFLVKFLVFLFDDIINIVKCQTIWQISRPPVNGNVSLLLRVLHQYIYYHVNSNCLVVPNKQRWEFSLFNLYILTADFPKEVRGLHLFAPCFCWNHLRWWKSDYPMSIAWGPEQGGVMTTMVTAIDKIDAAIEAVLNQVYTKF